MLENFEKLILDQQLISPGDRVLCAVSGGADSVCLLHALYHLRPRLHFELCAAHYNHKLRGELADSDAEFVSQFVALCCGPQRLADGSVLPPVLLVSGSGDVAAQAKRTGQGIEETARQMRYDFLQKAAADAGCRTIATAHNAGDNTETILFHLARGTGLRGLGGIQPKVGSLIRPLLTTARKEIEDYLLFYGLPHREDHTNCDDTYARNRIRHQVVPVLAELFDNLPGRMANTAALLRTDEDCLSALARQVALKAENKNGAFYIPAALLAQQHPAISTRAIRLLIGQLKGGDEDCAAVHLNGILDLCRPEASPSAHLDLPRGLIARREYDALVLSAGMSPSAFSPTAAALPGLTPTGCWSLCCTEEIYEGQPQSGTEFWLCKSAVPALTLRPRQVGDRLYLPGRPGKSVKKWLIDEKIPRSDRDLLPILDCGGKVAGAVLLGADTDFAAKPGQSAWHMIFQK